MRRQVNAHKLRRFVPEPPRNGFLGSELSQRLSDISRSPPRKLPIDDPQVYAGDFGLRTLIQLLHGPD